MYLLAALSLGFLGSFHCIGMCGPIALSIPVKRTSKLSIVSGAIIYNLGRVITYSLLGLIFGLLGQGFAMAGWQNILSITIGISILVLLFVPKMVKLKTNSGVILMGLEKIKSKLRQLFGIYSMQSLLVIGLLNGLLPCGLVYLGIAGSIATGDAIKGSLFMAAFGISTLPTMITLTLVRDYISLRFRKNIQKAIPLFIGAMAILLILRGMNLGIPYISPSIVKNSETCQHQCCHN